MAEYYNVTTNLGDAEIANAIATNTKLDITHVAFGDGNGSVPTPNKARTSLVREVHRQAVTKYERHATNANWIVIETIIPSSIGGFWVREMGIIANGKLISHGSHAPFEKVADPSGVSEYRLRFTQDVTDGSVVKITLGESLIYASQAWVNENYIKRSEIVDNLTTNEPAKPVSAKQAKVLQDTKLGKTENAATATKLQTARTIGGVSFNGSANINLPGVNTAGNQNTTGNAATATTAAACSGNAATATTAAACSGNAATATKLQTARTIGGVSFDGSANINLPGVNTAGNQNTSGNAASATNCSRSVIAGNGLSGGGALTSDSTVTLGTPGNITATSTNSVTETSHTHNLDVNSLPFLGTGINKRKSIISGTTYTNTGNRPIFVTCSMSGSSSIAASATLDGRMIFSTNSSNQYSQSFVVGVGVSYRFTGNGLVCEEYS